MILTIPSIYERVQVEESNKTVETIVPYKYIMDWMLKDPELDQGRILSQLQEYGIDTISMEPDTLSTLQQKGELTVISVPRMSELLIFNQMDVFHEKIKTHRINEAFKDCVVPLGDSAEGLFLFIF